MKIVTDPIPAGERAKPAGRVRHIAKQTNVVLRRHLANLRTVVTRAGGVAALEAALGDDAAELQAAYDAAKTAADALDPGDPVPAIE